jgi:hypothetical protein
MFLNNPQEAREVYLRYRAEKITPEQTGSDVVLEDFERMRRSDQVTPLMDEIETMFRQPSANARTLMR